MSKQIEGKNMKKELFDIIGMSCSACSAHIEKEISGLRGVGTVSVNLLKNSMSVIYDEATLNTEKIIKKVEESGYSAALHKQTAPGTKPDTSLQSMKKQLIISLVFTLPLFYIAMGEMTGFPMPSFLTGVQNAMVYAIVQLILVIPVIIACNRYFRSGIKNLYRRSPNMDSLIALGSGSAFIYGIYAICKIAIGFKYDDMHTVHDFSMNLYFESSAMILTLITLGKYFEAKAKNRTSQAITKLMDLSPKTATVIRDGMEYEIFSDDVVLNDILVVKAGNAVPVDGIITEGSSSIDESAITGESLPVEKNEGDKVTGGTINKSGYFKMRATAVGENTTLYKIIQLVDEATSSKAPIAKLADKISSIFVPVVIGIAVISTVIWLLLGQSFEFALSIGISVLVISCPCALGLATPTAIMVGTGKGAANGILIKSAQSLETARSIDTVILDKTGTVTQGKPSVTDIYPIGTDKDNLLTIAASLENMSSHPFSESIVTNAQASGIVLKNVHNYKLIPGQGISGIIDSAHCFAGNRKLMAAAGIGVSEYADIEENFALEGKTPLFFASENKLIGIIALSDVIKPTSKQAVELLEQMGIDVIMITGDNLRTAEAIRKQAGLNKVIAEVLPEGKEREVQALQQQGRKVAMVGDGINDSPALARSDVGIAIGAGTDIAIESADIVLIKSDLMDVPLSISLSRAVFKNIKQNLFWAFIYNLIGIPVAAGILYHSFGLLLNPMIAAAAMSLSSVSVVMNALRLKFFTPKWQS